MYINKNFLDVLENSKRRKEKVRQVDKKEGMKEMDISGKLQSVYTRNFISVTLSNILNGLM